MSIVALILCILFVFWLLRMEYKENLSASWELWIPTIWMIKIATRDLAFWLGRAGAESGSGSPYERYLLIFLLMLGIIVLYKRRLNIYWAIKKNFWVMALITYMFLSMFWTEVPFMTFKRWVRELIAVVMALVIFSETNPRNAIESVIRRSIYTLIPLSLVLVMFFPDHGTRPFGEIVAWVGVTEHKNGLGRLCYIAIFFLISAFFRRWLTNESLTFRSRMYGDLLVFAIALYLMKGEGLGKSVSVTAVMTLMIGLASFFGFQLLRKLKRNIGLNILRWLIAGIIFIGTSSVFVGGLVVGVDVASSMGREETLTGRTEIWANLIPSVINAPLLGYGIDGFFTEETQKSFHKLPHAHNGYLSILLDYGFVGLLLVSVFLLSSCRKAYQTMKYDYIWGVSWMCFLIMSVFRDIAEPSLDTFTSQPMAILLLLYASSADLQGANK